ncbi:phage minor head protein [Cardiobacterium hominis]|uniref:phage head morphogenesis protein n=1 Tax=Cardiobacterium hominis TaxID=2718 RepID=UPI00370D5BF9
MAHYPSAADYLRARGVEPAAEFYARLEHLRHEAWTLSKISDVEQIEQVKQSLVKALAEGKSFREWQQALTPGMLALPRHYQETVFRTAMLSSYNGAKWTHFRAHIGRRPILRYIAVNDHRTRPAHHALHGLMMPVEDERWANLAPPLGFNCRCSLVSLSDKQAKALGYSGAPEKLPTWEDDHGVSHTAAADKGWGSPERRDLTDYLRQKEAKAGLGKAAYTEPSPPFPTPENWRDVAKMGEEIWGRHSDLLDSVNFDWLQDILPHQMDSALPEKRDEFLNALLAVMKREGVETGAQAKAEGDAVKKFKEIIGRYPASWVNKANSTGTVYIRNLTDRGYHLFIDDRMSLVVKNKRWLNSQGLRVFSKFAEQLQAGDSLLYLNEMTGKEVAYNAARISIHEYGHRLQRTVSGLDDYFKQFWLDRTAGEKTKPLADFAKDKGTSHYSRTEVGREDSFVDGYIGRNYGDDDNPQPREVLTMTFQALLGGDAHLLKKMLDNDREMIYLGIGLLTRFTP